MPVPLSTIMNTIADFGFSGLATAETKYTHELDDSSKNSKELVHVAGEIETRIRALYKNYGDLIKSRLQSISPRFEGTFSSSFIYRTYPNKSRKIPDEVSLHVGLKKDSMRKNLSYFNRILYGDDTRTFSRATPKFIRWALSKKLIYQDSEGVYRKIAYSTTKKYRGKQLKGEKFRGMLTYHPGILSEINSLKQELQPQIDNDIKTTVAQILRESGIS